VLIGSVIALLTGRGGFMNKRVLALLLGIAACSRGGQSGGSTDSAAGDVATDPPTRAARLSSMEGTVSLQAPGSDDWTQPSPNYTLSTGDRLYAGQDAHAELDFGSGAVRLDHGGDLTLTNLTDNFTQLGLDEGALEASLYRYDKGDSLEFDTPNGALVPTGPGTYIVSIEPNGGTVVEVESGALEISGPGLEQTLNAGQVVRLVGTNPIQIVSLDASYAQTQPAFSDLDAWRSRRDPLYTSTGYASRYVSPSIPGWEDLDDNGVWLADAANTQVWCPTRVSRTWVPYREGRWSWVEPWGWTWVDDQPWGYAPFHYGRWETVANNRCTSSWAWVPGPVVAQPVWAPALVAFVDGAALDLSQGPNVEAWFPLGPTAPYFPWYHHSDAYLRDVNITNLIQVRDVDAVIRDKDLADHRWINRDNALTAVSSAAFGGGDPVGRHAIKLRTDLLPPIRIAQHPAVNPRRELLAGGAPAPRPRFAERPQTLVTRAAPHGGVYERAIRNAPASRPAPVITRNQPPGQRRTAGGEVGPPLPHGSGKNDGGDREADAPAPRASASPRPLIARNAAPPPRPNAAERQSAMQAHPGRPLEPRQTDNLRAGRPAGAPHDHEVPNHRAAGPAAPQVQPPRSPAQPSHPAPARPAQKPPNGKPDRPGGGGGGRGHEG
jgi:hypothetical protein